MIKAVVFDCFGVLTADIWREFVMRLPDQKMQQAAHDLNHALDAGFISHQEFVANVHALTGTFPPELEQKNTTYVHQKNIALLRYIEEKLCPKYKIGILSNISSNWITDSFLSEAEQRLFDVMIFSYQVGLTKPDERIYRLLCEKLKMQPQDVCYVDDVEGYVAAAAEIGIKGIVYSDYQQCTAEIDKIISNKV
jgi:HAD superfamily hydrolase (TIGR01509 family)